MTNTYLQNHLPAGSRHAVYLPPKARLATWQEAAQDKLWKYPEAVKTAACGLAHGHAQDHALARLDDVSRTLGVATIAGLGSLGTSQVGGSLPLWLGGASWLGAMAITPMLINAAVYAKTGVNPGLKYINSNGQMVRLYQDPSYLPLDVLSQNTRESISNQTGIPVKDPDHETLFQDKMKQIAVQTHTWWMLMAGLATPVLASVICDRLEDPFKSLTSRLRQWAAYQKLTPALKTKNADKIAKAVSNTIQASVGSGNEVTLLSRWWKALPEDLVETLNLKKLAQADLLHPSSNHRFSKVVNHLTSELQQTSQRASLENLLFRQQERLDSILTPLEKLLERKDVKRFLPKGVYDKLTQQLGLYRGAAEGTLRHFNTLLQLPLNKLPKAQSQQLIRKHMESAVLGYVEQASRLGEISKASRAAGGTNGLKNVMGAFSSGRFGPAFDQMGASPKSFLLKAANNLGLRRRWFQRFPLLLGATMVISTAIYMALFLGRDLEAPKSGGKA